MVRILHVFGGLNRGGAETMIMNLYRNVDKSIVQFDFITHNENMRDYAEEICSMGGKIYVFPKFTGGNYIELTKKWSEFFSNHPEYTILHSHVRSYASLYIPIAKKNGVKTIIHSHSTSNGSGIKSLVKKLLQFPLRYQADRFIGCSDASGEWLFGKKVTRSEKYTTLQNAIDIDKFKFNNVVRSQYRAELDLNGRVYIHVGRLHPAKNHSFLLEVFSQIKGLDPTAVLLIVGDGELRQSIESQIISLDLASSVRMLGSRSDVENLLMAADVFLFPSEWEGVPLTVVEAQASGLPCLVSDRVTRDVCVSDLVVRLPIDEGADCWARYAETLDINRRDVSSEIAAAGYDVRKNARWLEDYYLELLDG